MISVLLIQLPIPKLNIGKKTGNIPLGAACLKQAASVVPHADVHVLPESQASYLGDAALVDLVIEKKPDLLGFSVFNWNVERSLFIAGQAKERLGCRVVFGGPEVTPDNKLIITDVVDEYVYGEGEQAFVDLLNGVKASESLCRYACAEHIFKASPSPYPGNHLEPFIENLMLLETQRGCPYHCGFCFYNKSRGTLAFKDNGLLLDGVQWAVDQGIEELYLLDPSLNARPDLKSVLKQIARINKGKKVAINSEIRAEWIDADMADLFEQAGFTGFEIGLQTTNTKALEIMKRPTNLAKFIRGANLLKERDILPRIDLISGLPGDDLSGFSRSIAFVDEHELYDDIQVFPLSVLPGTSFRRHSDELGIRYETTPPYTVLETKTFSQDDLMLSFDYAESLFDVALFPLPELNIAWKKGNAAPLEDIWMTVGDFRGLARLVIDRYRPMDEIKRLSRFLTFPYQVYVNSNVKDEDYILKCLEILSKNNPYSPIEIIFILPKLFPDRDGYLEHINLKRPHYLDNDLRFIHGKPGNRAVLFTVISQSEHTLFTGAMKRQIYYWNAAHLPEPNEIDKLGHFDGIVIDTPSNESAVTSWQEHFAPSVNYIPQISFSRIDFQERWITRIMGDEYLNGIFIEERMTLD